VQDVVASQGFEVERAPRWPGLAREEPEDVPHNELRLLWLRFWFAGAIAVPILLLSHPGLIGLGAALPPGSAGWRAVSGALGALTVLAVLFSGVDLYRDAWAAFKRRTVDANCLITIAITVAWLYSTAVVVAPGVVSAAARGILFFDVAAAVVALVSLAHAVEAQVRRRPRSAVERLQRAQPETARVVGDGPERIVAVEELAAGDVIVVCPWERIPADGTVIAGASTVDETELTGGGLAQEKRRCDPVMAGTTNGPGAFSFRATQVGKDTVLSQVTRMIEDAQASRTRVRQGVATLAQDLVPAMLILSIIGLLAWYTLGTPPKAPHALSVFLSTLILASSGALGLAAGVPVEVAIGVAADRGIVFASGRVVGDSAALDTIFIDESAITDDAPGAISELKKMGHEILMLSCGAADAATRRAAELGVDGAVRGGASGVEHAIRLKQEVKRLAVIGCPPFGSSAEIPADVSATIGVTGQLGIGAADITVLRRSLGAVSSALRLSRSATRAVAQNLVGTTAYYVLGLPLALGALSIASGPRAAPLIVALLMAGVWIAVVGNAARLRLPRQDCE
jgi:Cu+-exporting ATPase